MVSELEVAETILEMEIKNGNKDSIKSAYAKKVELLKTQGIL